MQRSVLIVGIEAFMLGAWFDVGVFLSGGSGAAMPITWVAFIIPASITGVGAIFIVLGLKRKSTNRSATTISNNQ